MDKHVIHPPYPAATQPTLYFIGVTTGRSSIMRVFPEWARLLALGDCSIKGMDFGLHDEPSRYREAVSFIKSDSKSLGALVTTHKIDLYHACRDQFDELDPFANLLGEVSCISKNGGRELVGHAKDAVTSGLALESFLPPGYWERTGAEVLVLGAGGSAVAITSYLLRDEHGLNRPTRVVVANRSVPRLKAMQEVHRQVGAAGCVEYVHTPTPEMSDLLLSGLKPGSLVINATGLGKDAPGSPITDSARFPERGIAWEFNYRGDLVFLQQAKKQEQERQLQIEDGWTYFIYGWTRTIAEVFHAEIPVKGPTFDNLCRIAAQVRN